MPTIFEIYIYLGDISKHILYLFFLLRLYILIILAVACYELRITRNILTCIIYMFF